MKKITLMVFAVFSVMLVFGQERPESFKDYQLEKEQQAQQEEIQEPSVYRAPVTHHTPKPGRVQPIFRDGTMGYAWNIYAAASGVDEGPVSVNLDDGTISNIQDIDSDVIWMAAGDMAGEVWYVASYDQTNAGLYTVDPATGDYTLVGNMGYSITGLAYDHDADVMFASGYDGANSQLYTVDLADGSTSHVGQISSGIIIGIAADIDGNLYGINLDDNLYSIDSSTGTGTLIGPLGVTINYAQDIGYDRDNDILYGTLYAASGGLYTIDTDAGTATLINNFVAEVAGFGIPYTVAEAEAPAAVTNFSLTAGADGALEANLSWNNPDETVDGDPLTELDAVLIYRDGDLIHTITDPVIGAAETYQDNTITEAGNYTYLVVGENAFGEGLPVSETIYIGEDVPAAPGNVTLVADGNDGLVSWDAPTEGYHGGYFTGDNLTYTIVRFPDEEEVGTDVTGETFTDETVPGIGNFYYTVMASNDIGDGGTAESNVALLGADDILLYEIFDEEGVFPPVGWEWVNGEDGSYWEQSSLNSYTGDFSARSYQGVSSGYVADEWLITPQIDMDNPEAQMLTFYGLSSQAPDGVRENMRIMAVDQYYDNVDDLHDNATLIEVVPFEGEWSDHIVDISGLSGQQHLVFHYYITEEDDASFNWIYVDHVMVGDFDTFTLTMMDPVGEGTVSPEVGDHLYMENTEVTLNAEADYTWEFDSWEVDGDFYSDEANTSITITEDVNVQAIFNALESFILTMEDPEGEGSVDPEPGDHSYLEDDVVTLTATADMGWVFSHWTGNVDDPDANQTTITMDDDYTVKAHFVEFDGLDLPWAENFSGVPSGEIPANWTRTHENWGVNISDNAGGEAPEMRFHWSPASTDVFRLTSPNINTSGYDALLLTLDHYVNNFSSPGIYTLRIIAIADGDEYIIEEWVDPDNIGPEELELIITEDQHGVGTDDFFIVWEFDGDSYDINQWYFDNVHLGEAPDMYEVSFYVLEDSAEEDPIEGATINIDGDIYTTDENGMAVMMLADDITYEASITASGYVAEEVTFTVDGDDKTIEVHMMDNIVEPFNLSVITEDMDPGEALFIWNDYGDEYEFRYDDGVVDAQLGFQGTWNSVMGAAHHYEAILHEMTWQLTSEGGPHTTVKVWVLGLDANGLPDRNDVLYTAENVPNTDGQWNTYEFTEPIDAPDGFFLGLSYNGFLGLAVDDGVGEPWDFVPGTQFGVFDITDPSSAFTDIADWDFEVNYLLRAYGANLGSIDYGKVQTPVAAGPAPELIPVDKPYYAGDPKGRDGSKVFLGFNVFLNEDLVAEEYMETEYLFTDLPEGEHTAGVQSVYTTGSSDIIEVEFTMEETEAYTVTFNVVDEEDNPITDAVVTFDGEEYDAGEYTIEDVAPGTYDYMVAKEGYQDATGEVTVVDENVTVDVTLMEPVETFAVSFNVDMEPAGEEFDPDMHEVYISGSFGGDMEWQEPGTNPDLLLERIDDTMIFTITLDIAAGEHEYKYFSDFVDDGWDGGEWPGEPNREITVDGDKEVNDVWGDPVSVTDIATASLNLYPNPASTSLTIVSDEHINEIRMIDMLGKVVYATNVENDRYTMNVSGFDNGIYFVQILTDKGLSTKRVQIAK